jgi:hypothetical protein
MKEVYKSDVWLANQFLYYVNPINPIKTDIIERYKGKDIPLPNQLSWRIYSLLGYIAFSVKSSSEKNKLKGK